MGGAILTTLAAMSMNFFPRVSKMILSSDDPSWIRSLSCQRHACRDMPLDNDDTLHNTSLSPIWGGAITSNSNDLPQLQPKQLPQVLDYNYYFWLLPWGVPFWPRWLLCQWTSFLGFQNDPYLQWSLLDLISLLSTSAGTLMICSTIPLYPRFGEGGNYF